MPLPPFHRLAVRLFLLGISTLIGLLLAEFAVRLARPQPVMVVSRGLYQPDPPRRYRLQPGFRGMLTNRVEFDTQIAVNRAGLRGPEIGPKAPGTLRVLAVGDSFVFGVGAQAEETYPAQLQRILRSRGLKAEVLNAGEPGFGVPDAVAWYQRWGWPLEPDVVLVATFLGNDFQDAAPGGPKVEAVDGVLKVRGETTGVLSQWLYYHSHLYVLLKSSNLGRPIRRLLGRPEPLETRQLRGELDLYEKGTVAKVFREGGAAQEKALAALVESGGGARIVGVIVPSLIQTDPARWQASLKRFGLDARKYDPGQPTRWAREMFIRQGIPVVDLTEPFSQAIRNGRKIYYPIDQHLTPEGYRLMAETVAQKGF